LSNRESERLTGININNTAIDCRIAENAHRAGDAEEAPDETDEDSHNLTAPVDDIEEFVLEKRKKD